MVTNAEADTHLRDDTFSEGEDCTPSYAVNARAVGVYSPIRDPDSEQDIARYVEIEADDENVQHVELIKTEYVAGEKYQVWDVLTDKNRWWVLTNITNLYLQSDFPSLDYTLSFHVGLMLRVRSQRNSADHEEPHALDEVFRRQAQAAERLDRAVEAVDFQAVAMQMRECLLALSTALRRTIDLQAENSPKEADFKAWIELVISKLCPGGAKKELRSYLKSNAEKTWALVNWLTHYRRASKIECDILMNACGTLVGDLWSLLDHEMTNPLAECPNCISRHMRSHYDADFGEEGTYYVTCGVCGWSDHPERTSPKNEGPTGKPTGPQE